MEQSGESSRAETIGLAARGGSHDGRVAQRLRGHKRGALVLHGQQLRLGVVGLGGAAEDGVGVAVDAGGEEGEKVQDGDEPGDGDDRGAGGA